MTDSGVSSQSCGNHLIRTRFSENGKTPHLRVCNGMRMQSRGFRNCCKTLGSLQQAKTAFQSACAEGAPTLPRCINRHTAEKTSLSAGTLRESSRQLQKNCWFRASTDSARTVRESNGFQSCEIGRAPSGAWQGECKAATFTQSALSPDCAAMGLDQLLRDG